MFDFEYPSMLQNKQPNRRTGRDTSSWGDSSTVYQSFEDFLKITSLETGLHSIHDGAEIIDFFYQDSESDRLAVFFHGAIKAELVNGLKLPVFSGLHIDLGMAVDRVLFSDATLASHNRMVLGWFCGNTALDLPSRIDQILLKIDEIKRYKRILMLGGSQGGFTALRATYRLPESIALVWNPQTSIERFFKQERIDNFAKFCFGVKGFAQLNPKLSEERAFDLTKLYEGGGNSNFVFYMQNLEDTQHVVDHALPFCEAINPKMEPLKIGINQITPNVVCAMGDWVGGHSLVDRDALTSVAHHLLRSEKSNAELFASDDLSKTLPDSFTAHQVTHPKSVQAVIADEIASKQEKLSGRVAFSDRERVGFREILESVKPEWYLEYGSGGSYRIAKAVGFKHITSVDSDKSRIDRFLEQHLEKVSEDCEQVQFLHADIGKVDEAGFPVHLKTCPSWPRYCTLPWHARPKGATSPSLVFVNGPFALSCCLHTAMRLSLLGRPSESVVILRGLHRNGTAHETLMKYFDFGPRIDGLCALRVKKDCDQEDLLQDFAESVLTSH